MVLTNIIEKSSETLTPDETEAVLQDLAARMNMAAIARRMAQEEAENCPGAGNGFGQPDPRTRPKADRPLRTLAALQLAKPDFRASRSGIDQSRSTLRDKFVTGVQRF